MNPSHRGPGPSLSDICGTCGLDTGPGGGNRVYAGGQLIAVRCPDCMSVAMDSATRRMASRVNAPPSPPRLRLVQE